MRLIFKPFKIILKILISILIIPAIFLAFLWKPVSVPKDDYSSGVVTIEDTVTNSVDTFLEEEIDRKPLNLTLSSKVVNNELRKQLLDQFNSSTTNLDYVYEDGIVNFQGAWIDYEEDVLNIRAGVHLDLKFMIYKTSVLLKFKVVDTDGIVELKLTKFNLGNIPLAWASSFTAGILKKTVDIDVEQMVADQVGSIGEFNLKERSLKIDLRKIAQKDDTNKEIIEMVINLIYSEDLVDFGINEVDELYQLGLKLNIDQLEDKTPAFILNTLDRIKTPVEFEQYLMATLNIDTTNILTTLLTDKPQFTLTELDLNKVLDYFITESMQLSTEGLLQEMKIYEHYEMKVLMPYIEVDDAETSINIPIRLGKIGGNEFMTTIRLVTDISILDKDLMFDIQSVRFGDLLIEGSYIETIIGLLGTSGNLNNDGTKIVFKDFANNFAQYGLSFNAIEVISDELVISYEIAGVTDGLANIDDFLSTPLPPNVVDDINAVLTDPSDEAAINDLVSSIGDLTPEEQEEILQALQDAFNALP